jgi:hypothetical protein
MYHQHLATIIIMFEKVNCEPGVVAHICNPYTQETEAEGSQVWGQSGLHKETLSQKQNRTEKKRKKKKTHKKTKSIVVLNIIAQ